MGAWKHERVWERGYNIVYAIILTCMYRIAGNFRGRKLSRIGRKGAFRRENSCGMLKLVA